MAQPQQAVLQAPARNTLRSQLTQQQQNDPWTRGAFPDHVSGKYDPQYAEIDTISGFPAPDGVKGPNNTPFPRRINFNYGGRELTRIVAGLQKGVRQINGTQTKAGAIDWINRNHKKNWTAHEADITGANNKPDGIDEVFVLDGKGNLKIINGYALGPSHYGWRKAYYEKYPDRDDQLDNPFMEFKRQYKKYSKELDQQGHFQYLNVLDGKAAHIRGKIKARNIYRQIFFTPTYKLFVEDIKATYNFSPMDYSKISSRVFSFVYDILFLRPAICNAITGITPDNYDAQDEKTYSRNKKDKAVLVMQDNILQDYMGDLTSQVVLFYLTASLISCSLKYDFNIPLDDNKEIYGIPIGILCDYQTVRDDMDDVKAQADRINRDIEDHENALEEAILDKLAERQAGVDERRELQNNSAIAWFDNPMYDPVIARRRRDLGWAQYTQYGDPNPIINDISTKITTRNNNLGTLRDAHFGRHIVMGPPQQQQQQQAPRQGGGGLHFGSRVLNRAGQQQQQAPQQQAPQQQAPQQQAPQQQAPAQGTGLRFGSRRLNQGGQQQQQQQTTGLPNVAQIKANLISELEQLTGSHQAVWDTMTPMQLSQERTRIVDSITGGGGQSTAQQQKDQMDQNALNTAQKNGIPVTAPANSEPPSQPNSPQQK